MCVRGFWCRHAAGTPQCVFGQYIIGAAGVASYGSLHGDAGLPHKGHTLMARRPPDTTHVKGGGRDLRRPGAPPSPDVWQTLSVHKTAKVSVFCFFIQKSVCFFLYSSAALLAWRGQAHYALRAAARPPRGHVHVPPIVWQRLPCDERTDACDSLCSLIKFWWPPCEPRWPLHGCITRVSAPPKRASVVRTLWAPCAEAV